MVDLPQLEVLLSKAPDAYTQHELRPLMLLAVAELKLWRNGELLLGGARFASEEDRLEEVNRTLRAVHGDRRASDQHTTEHGAAAI